MDRYITGAGIKQLREQRKMTQLELAGVLGVSDKTVSKWETGKGYPDITLLEPIADAFGISVPELISGQRIKNENVSANMIRSKFYICPVCGNVIHSMGEAVVHCHGIQLLPAAAEQTDEETRCADFYDASKPACSPCPSGWGSDEDHMTFVERVEDEYFVRIDHEMTKTHYISFIAAVSSDRCQMVKLYPEGEAEARFMISGVCKIFFYCNRDGLFCQDVIKRRGEH